ncbi:MAG: hypothetical protein L3K15_00170 [Thermoplasmata archaeon]|nr:hypothetical protein [Thermoplasmata archaeon]
MNRRQRLFDNDYTAGPGLSTATTVRFGKRGVVGLPGSLMILLLTVVYGLSVAGSPSGLATGSPSVPLGGDLPTPISAEPLSPGSLTSYDTGKVSVVFPSTQPRVHLYQDANTSVGATLDFVEVVEIGAVGSGAPPPVAAAFPLALASFNGTGAPTAPGAPLAFTATLGVVPVQGAAIGSNASLVVVGTAIGTASVRIAYNLTATNPATGGVVVHWSVAGWPWVHPGDLLGVVFSLTNSVHHPFVACPAAAAAGSACGGTTVAAGTTQWNTGLTGVEAAYGNGSVAEVGVNASESFGGAPVVDDGVYAPSDGAVELLIAAPAHDGTPVGGTMTFALVTSFGPLHSALLRGMPAVFVGTIALGAVGASGLVWAYRRRERRVRAQL